jgi:hypothetical protein
MTLTIPVPCPRCPGLVLRVPLTAFDTAEGRYLGVDADELLEHVTMHEEAR